MTLDELTDRLGLEARTAKEQVVATGQDNIDLDPRLFFYRAGEPVASVGVKSRQPRCFLEALEVGASGFDAEVSAAVFDTYTFQATLDEDAQPVDDGLVEIGEALQIYSANRAGDVRWVQHSFAIHGKTVEWLAPHRFTGDKSGNEMLNRLKAEMEGPSMMQMLHKHAPAWAKKALAASAEMTGPEENRYILDLGTAESIGSLAPGQMFITIYGEEGTQRYEIMERYKPYFFPNQP